MKKIVAILMVLVITFSLAGCGLFEAVGEAVSDYLTSDEFEEDAKKAASEIEALLD